MDGKHSDLININFNMQLHPPDGVLFLYNNVEFCSKVCYNLPIALIKAYIITFEWADSYRMEDICYDFCNVGVYIRQC